MTRLPGILAVLLLGCGPENPCLGDGECVAANDGTGADASTQAAPSTDADPSPGADVDSDSGPDPGPDAPGGNNWACMSNGDYPAGVVDDPTLRKIIPYTMLGGAADFDLGPMTISRQSRTSGFTRTHVPVTNVGASTRCFIEIDAVSFLNGGAALVGTESGFVQGSVAVLGSGAFTDTCLAPGESGYFFLITEVDFESISEASFVIDDSDFLAIPPAQSAVPTEYVVDGVDLDITVEHLGG